MILDPDTHTAGSMGTPQSVLPEVGQVSDELWERIANGQPVVLLHHGRPAAVVVDYESWQEVEALAAGE